jgi:hypothetical protein
VPRENSDEEVPLVIVEYVDPDEFVRPFEVIEEEPVAPSMTTVFSAIIESLMDQDRPENSTAPDMLPSTHVEVDGVIEEVQVCSADVYQPSTSFVSRRTQEKKNQKEESERKKLEAKKEEVEAKKKKVKRKGKAKKKTSSNTPSNKPEPPEVGATPPTEMPGPSFDDDGFMTPPAFIVRKATGSGQAGNSSDRGCFSDVSGPTVSDSWSCMTDRKHASDASKVHNYLRKRGYKSPEREIDIDEVLAQPTICNEPICNDPGEGPSGQGRMESIAGAVLGASNVTPQTTRESPAFHLRREEFDLRPKKKQKIESPVKTRENETEALKTTKQRLVKLTKEYPQLEQVRMGLLLPAVISPSATPNKATTSKTPGKSIPVAPRQEEDEEKAENERAAEKRIEELRVPLNAIPEVDGLAEDKLHQRCVEVIMGKRAKNTSKGALFNSVIMKSEKYAPGMFVVLKVCTGNGVRSGPSLVFLYWYHISIHIFVSK